MSSPRTRCPGAERRVLPVKGEGPHGNRPGGVRCGDSLARRGTNLGPKLEPLTPKHHAKPASTRYQKTRPASQQDTEARRICKTSIPGSIRAAPPNFSSNSIVCALAAQGHASNWTTVDYNKSAACRCGRSRKPLIQNRLNSRDFERGGGSQDLHPSWRLRRE